MYVLSKEKQGQVNKLLLSGVSVRKVVELAGVSKATVWRYRKILLGSGAHLPDRSAAMRMFHLRRHAERMSQKDDVEDPVAEVSSSDSEKYAFVGIRKCGCVVRCCIDGDGPYTESNKAEMVRLGLTIKRVPIEEARKLLVDVCPHMRQDNVNAARHHQRKTLVEATREEPEREDLDTLE